VFLSKLSAITLALALLDPGLYAQDSGTLKITVIQGQSEKNNIKLKLAVTPIVEVRDEHDRLVPGARISFVLPNFGPSGRFADGTASMLVWTDSQGRAAATGLVPNSTEGKFNIRVSATYAGKEGTATVLQENTAADGPQQAQAAIDAKKKSNNKWIYIVVAGGGAAVAGIFAAKGGSSAPSGPAPPTPTSVTVGTVSVGGPR
jgi:hypothetical protein